MRRRSRHHSRNIGAALAALMTCLVPIIASAADPPPTKIEVIPQRLSLSGTRDRAQLVVTGYYADGRVRDVTGEAKFTTAARQIATVQSGVIRPTGDGTTKITATVAGRSRQFEVKVANFSPADQVSFNHEVLPMLWKQGCSAGTCHGSPNGKGGFRLSLRAFDPKLDAQTLTREEFGRRTNPLDPDQSLMLVKPMMRVAHGGGLQLNRTDAAHEVLRSWIAEGCRVEAAEEVSKCEKITVYPGESRVAQWPDRTQQLCVLAHFADGRVRDVTRLARYEPSDRMLATVSAEGLVKGLDRGEAVIVVQYLNQTETARVTFLRDVEGFVWNRPVEANYIDRHVYAKLKQLQYTPSSLCSDEVFVRRVYLDVIGLLPTLEERKAFLEDKSSDKRKKLIDQLLGRDEYAKFWTLKWGDLLRMSKKQLGAEGLPRYHAWVHKAITDNMPYDQFVVAMLTATGDTSKNPAAHYYLTEGNTDYAVETTAQTFLGVRIQCAKCHNHPDDRWTMDDYYGLSAFFNRIERKPTKTKVPDKKNKKKKTKTIVSTLVSVAKQGEVKHPSTGEAMQPWVPGAGVLSVAPEADRRQALAQWIARKDNPYLARVEVNRIWSEVMGRGIVESSDDFRDSNPPSNEPLLAALAADFVAHKFDRKHILRTILNSRTYQASSEPTELSRNETKYFSHYLARRLSAEQLLDAIGYVTELPERFPKQPPETRATQLMAPDLFNNDFLKVFGQPSRQQACLCERGRETSLPQALHLYNGKLLHNKLRNKASRFHKRLAAKAEPAVIITELFEVGLCRKPSEKELASCLEYFETRKRSPAAMEDICWAVLNMNEFLFQR